MYSKLLSGTALGIDGLIITVETDISQGIPGLNLVGYLSSSVKEAAERVRTALRNSGVFLPSRKITVNLSPADVRKDGAGYDLAIAIGILLSMEIIPKGVFINMGLQETLFIGELGLDGKVLPVRGVLPIVDFAYSQGIKRVVLPCENAEEASFVRGLDIIPVDSLDEIVGIMNKGCWPEEFRLDSNNLNVEEETINDLADVKGQEILKRGIIIAVAGFHNIMMTGSAGAGKSMIAKCIPGIMPPLTYEESMKLTKIYSVAGLLNSDMRFINRRPFRSLNQNISQVALLGGGTNPKPGEVSLANSGVLFLDEFPEFSRGVVESLRQPMEDKVINISRVKASYTFPADFMLVSARNNCPCGFYPDRRRCRCNMGEIYRYQNRISHPIMDRIDIRLEVRNIEFDELMSEEGCISSAQAREIIMTARDRQMTRYKDESFDYNSQLPQSKIDKYIHLSDSQMEYLRNYYDNNDISARGYFRILRLIRTIADIEDREEISDDDIAEATFYRNESDAGRNTI